MLNVLVFSFFQFSQIKFFDQLFNHSLLVLFSIYNFSIVLHQLSFFKKVFENNGPICFLNGQSLISSENGFYTLPHVFFFGYTLVMRIDSIRVFSKSAYRKYHHDCFVKFFVTKQVKTVLTRLKQSTRNLVHYIALFSIDQKQTANRVNDVVIGNVVYRQWSQYMTR